MKNHSSALKQYILTNREYLGNHAAFAWRNDSKHLLFSLSRYKFISKILFGKRITLEIGAGDGWFSKIVGDNVKELVLSDIIIENKNFFKQNSHNKYDYIIHDFTKSTLKRKFDAIYSVDIFEHIKIKKEISFLTNSIKSLDKNGIYIIGTPSKESQKYASKYSKLYHVNCKTQNELRNLMNKFFFNVLIFSMNDEVVHTGFSGMSHYNFAVCTQKRFFNY
jgi:cyclopropane fatty-acyl-phospholipid synthase-like methyltransferase